MQLFSALWQTGRAGTSSTWSSVCQRHGCWLYSCRFQLGSSGLWTYGSTSWFWLWRLFLALQLLSVWSPCSYFSTVLKQHTQTLAQQGTAARTSHEHLHENVRSLHDHSRLLQCRADFLDHPAGIERLVTDLADWLTRSSAVSIYERRVLKVFMVSHIANYYV